MKLNVDISSLGTGQLALLFNVFKKIDEARRHANAVLLSEQTVALEKWRKRNDEITQKSDAEVRRIVAGCPRAK